MFATTDNARIVYVLVPMLTTTTSTDTKVITVDKFPDDTFSNFKNPTTSG